jgi:hypothetical protein
MSEEQLTLEEKIHANALLVIKLLSEAAGFELGFNEESVAWIDGFIERQRTAEDVEPEFIASLVSRLGSFLGECIRHEYGGEWKQLDGGLAVRFSPGNEAYPFNKVRKQFEHGSGDSILSFYKSVGVLFSSNDQRVVS